MLNISPTSYYVLKNKKTGKFAGYNAHSDWWFESGLHSAYFWTNLEHLQTSFNNMPDYVAEDLFPVMINMNELPVDQF